MTIKCKKCNGANLEQKVWADVATDRVLDVVDGDDIDDQWCNDCEEHVEFITKEDD